MHAPIAPKGLQEDPELTGRLRAWLAGNSPGANESMDALGSELSAIAQRILFQQPPGGTLQATALLNECWLKLSQTSAGSFKDRRHFMGLAVTTMRCIVVDHAKAKRAQKRTPQGERIELESVVSALEDRGGVDLVELDDALEALGSEDPDALKVIELRFFGGLTLEETSDLLGWTRNRVRSEEILACKRLARLMS